MNKKNGPIVTVLLHYDFNTVVHQANSTFLLVRFTSSSVCRTIYLFEIHLQTCDSSFMKLYMKMSQVTGTLIMFRFFYFSFIYKFLDWRVNFYDFRHSVWDKLRKDYFGVLAPLKEAQHFKTLSKCTSMLDENQNTEFQDFLDPQNQSVLW